MKILLMSDSHGRAGICLDVVEKYIDKADMFIHLGDGQDEFLEIMNIFKLKYISVMGNCDYGSGKFEEILFAENMNIIVCHGHHYGVSASLDSYLKHIREKNCQVGFFGHTHIPYYEKTSDGIYLINPGSIAKSRQGENSFCILDVNDGMVKADFYSSNTFKKLDIPKFGENQSEL